MKGDDGDDAVDGALEVALAVAHAPDPGALRRAWARRDNSVLRAYVTDLICFAASTDSGVGAADPLRIWRRFSHAVYSGNVTPILALLESIGCSTSVEASSELGEEEWQQLAVTTVAALRDQVPATAPDALTLDASIAVLVYFECLVFWEHSNDYTPVLGLVHALEHWQVRRDPGDPDEELAHVVVDSARDLAGTLPDQFLTETGIGSGAPQLIEAGARAAAASSRAVSERLSEVTSSGPHTARSPVLAVLVDLLRADMDETRRYHELSHEHLAPAFEAFIENLPQRSADPLVRDRLVATIQRCVGYEESEAGRGSVFATECRAHRMLLSSALDALEGGTRSLVVEQGSIVVVYPFGLPVTATGHDPVRRLLRSYLDGSAEPPVDEPVTLAGARIAIDDTPQTDAWVTASDGEALDYVGVRLLFPHDELRVEAADGMIYRNLGLEVRLGGLGNHYLRISADTDTAVSTDGGRSWHPVPGGWTPHLVDQFVRRAGAEGGEERVELLPRDAGADLGSERRTHECLLDFAAEVVHDLVGFARRLEVSEGHEHSADDGFARDTPRAIHDFLERHVQVALTVTKAVAVHGSARTRIEGPEQLRDVMGAGVLSTAQRPFAQCPIEWVRFAFDEHGSTSPVTERVRGELVMSMGDTTLLFAPTLPNWQVIETQELIEFACSLTGVYSRRQKWLRQLIDEADRSARTIDEESKATEDPATKELEGWLEDVRNAEIRLDEALNHVEVLLERARMFRLSRNQQSRQLIQHICARNGVVDLQDALAASARTAEAQERLIGTRRERLESQVARRRDEERERQRSLRQRPVELLLSALAVFGFIDLFWWAGESWGIVDNHEIWALEFGVLLLLGVGVYWTLWRHWKD